jgi:2-iminobutanoate/2-iminopropanoate deaminase
MRDAITFEKLGKPVGPFSPAVRTEQAIYVSGQVGEDKATGRLSEGTAAQTAQALENVRTVLEAAGATLDDVVRVGVYLTDMRDFATMNQVYARYFQSPFPARTTVQVAGLPLGASVEIDVVAVRHAP